MLNEDFSEIFQEIEKRNAKLVLLQMPEGLKTKAIGIAEQIEKKTNADTIIVIDPCFGACDIADVKMEIFGADLLIHFGHSRISKNKSNVMYFPMSHEIKERDLKNIVGKLAATLKKDSVGKVGIVATVQYIEHLKQIKNAIESAGVEVVVGRGDERIAQDGQVLGCNYSAVKNVEMGVDAIVFVGDGNFHVIGITYVVEKPVYFCDFSARKVKKMSEKEKEKFVKKRFGMVAKAKDAEKFLIIVSTKEGQKRAGLGRKLKELVESSGKKAYLASADLVKPEYIWGMDIDCIVNTACPRLAVDDAVLFNKPVISPIELELALGKRRIESFGFDEF